MPFEGKDPGLSSHLEKGRGIEGVLHTLYNLGCGDYDKYFSKSNSFMHFWIGNEILNTVGLCIADFVFLCQREHEVRGNFIIYKNRSKWVSNMEQSYCRLPKPFFS